MWIQLFDLFKSGPLGQYLLSWNGVFVIEELLDVFLAVMLTLAVAELLGSGVKQLDPVKSLTRTGTCCRVRLSLLTAELNCNLN